MDAQRPLNSVLKIALSPNSRRNCGFQTSGGKFLKVREQQEFVIQNSVNNSYTTEQQPKEAQMTKTHHLESNLGFEFPLSSTISSKKITDISSKEKLKISEFSKVVGALTSKRTDPPPKFSSSYLTKVTDYKNFKINGEALKIQNFKKSEQFLDGRVPKSLSRLMSNQNSMNSQIRFNTDRGNSSVSYAQSNSCQNSIDFAYPSSNFHIKSQARSISQISNGSANSRSFNQISFNSHCKTDGDQTLSNSATGQASTKNVLKNYLGPNEIRKCNLLTHDSIRIREDFKVRQQYSLANLVNASFESSKDSRYSRMTPINQNQFSITPGSEDNFKPLKIQSSNQEMYLPTTILRASKQSGHSFSTDSDLIGATSSNQVF